MADAIRVIYEFTRKLHYVMKLGFYTEDLIEKTKTGFLFDNDIEVIDDVPTGYFIVDGKRTNKVTRVVGELDGEHGFNTKTTEKKIFRDDAAGRIRDTQQMYKYPFDQDEKIEITLKKITEGIYYIKVQNMR